MGRLNVCLSVHRCFSRAAAPALAFAIVCSSVLAWERSAFALDGTDFRLSVLAYNLGGYVRPLSRVPNIRERMRRIEIENPDVLVLQEVRDDGLVGSEFPDFWDELRALLRFSAYHVYQTFPDSRAMRVVLSKYPIVSDRYSGPLFASGAAPTSEFIISVAGQRVRLNNVHFNPDGDAVLTARRLLDYVGWLDLIAPFTPGGETLPLISAGDFNQPVDGNPQYWGTFGTAFDHVCALKPSALCDSTYIDHIFLQKPRTGTTALTVAEARGPIFPDDGDHSAWAATFEGIEGDRGPLRVNSQTVPGVGVAADGRSVLCARGVNDELWCSDQVGPTGLNALSFRCFSSKGGVLRSNPAVGLSVTGNTKAFVSGTDANVWAYDDVLRSASLQPLPFTPLGGGPILEGTNPVLAHNADGRAQLFVVRSDGSLWSTAESATGSWSGWQRLGGGTWYDPAVARNEDGRLELFVTGSDRAIWRIAQTAPGTATWTGWSSLGGSFGESPVVAARGDGRLVVFGHEVTMIGTAYGVDNFKTTGTLVHLSQAAPNGPWETIPTPPWTPSIPAWKRMNDGQTFGRPALVANGDTGLLELAVTGTDNVTYLRTEAAAGGWAGWRALFDGAHRPVGPPLLARNAAGVTMLWMQDTTGKLPRWTVLAGNFTATSAGSDYCEL